MAASIHSSTGDMSALDPFQTLGQGGNVASMKMTVACVVAALALFGCAKSESAENVAKEMRSKPPPQPPKVNDGFSEVQPTDASNNSATE